MPEVALEVGLEYPRGNGAGARVEVKPGLRVDLDELDKHIGMVSQALTALGKVLDPVLGPEGPVQAEGESPVSERYRGERDVDVVVVGVAPLRERVEELSVGVRKLLARVDGLASRVEL